MMRRHEINTIEAIRRWVQKEIVGDHVTMEPIEAVDHHGNTIVRSRFDGPTTRPTSPAN
jgi:hypothetical protein